MALLGLAKAVLVFLLMIFAAWGVGRAGLSLVDKGFGTASRLARVLLATALGLGFVGQSVFVLGLLGDYYQPGCLGLFLGLLLPISVVALLKTRLPATDSGPIFSGPPLCREEILVIALAVISLLMWFWGLLSFTTGSDVISNHYQFVKHCLAMKHFAHNVTVPFGIDNYSTYSPVMVHMLYLIGTSLSDVRAANLIHWLGHAMMLMSLYVLARGLFSRAAGWAAVAICLGFSVLLNFSLDVSNYEFLAVFMLLSVHCIFLHRRTGSLAQLALAGVLAGLMLSTKYYGVALMPALCLPILFNGGQSLRERGKGVALFCGIAFLVFSPWVFYNLREFGNPIYPVMSDIECLKRWYPVRLVETLDPFIVPTDRGFFRPIVLYYLSVFIPFEPSYAVFGLTPIFLLSLPCSLYLLLRVKGERWREVNMLFAMSSVAFVLIELATFPIAFYKSAIFAGCLYAVSLSGAVALLEGKAKRWAWAAILLAAAFNTYADFRINRGQLHMPPIFSQERYWNPLVRYINENLESGASVANHDIHSSFYLRPDIESHPAYNIFLPYDWGQEEKLIRDLGVEYYVVYANERAGSRAYYERMLAMLTACRSFKRAASFEPALRQYTERTDRQQQFLGKFGRLVKELPGGIKIYRLRSAAA